MDNLIFGIYSRGEKAKEKYNLFLGYSYDNVMDKKIKLIKNLKEKEIVLKLVEFGLVPHQMLYEPIIFNKEDTIKNESKDITFNFKNNINDFKFIFKGNSENVINLYDNNLNHVNIDLKNN